MRLIDADIKLNKDTIPHYYDYSDEQLYAISAVLKNLPTVEAVPTRNIQDAIAEIEECLVDIQKHFDVLEVGANRAFLKSIRLIRKHTGVKDE